MKSFLLSATLLVAANGFMLPRITQQKALKPRQPSSSSVSINNAKLPRGALHHAVPFDSLNIAVGDFLALGALSTVPKLWALCSMCCSMAFLRQAYVFSLAYGLSAILVATTVIAQTAMPLNYLAMLHSGGLAVWGSRMFFFLWRRLIKGKGYKDKFKALDKTPRLKRLPLILSTSLFYALLMSPAPYFASSAAATCGLWNWGSSSSLVSSAGLTLMAYGFWVEALADYQKSTHKKVATTGQLWVQKGEWTKSRHANYFGEIVFWIGSFVAAAPGFGRRPIPWLAGSFGLAGIVAVMLSATKRLEKKQEETYGDIASWQDYAARTPALWPTSSTIAKDAFRALIIYFVCWMFPFEFVLTNLNSKAVWAFLTSNIFRM